MGISKTGKKMPRRVKKAIRRALSGVCMVSAIIVALVPAEVSEGYTTIPASAVAAYDYSYGVSDNGSDDITTNPTGMDLSLYDKSTGTFTGNTSFIDSITGEPYKTLYVRQDLQGNYEYGWQFKMYLQNYNSKSYGVICDYNSSYQADVLEVSKSLPYKYLTVPESEYDGFYNAFMNAGVAPTVSIDGKSYKTSYSMGAPAYANNQSIVTGSDEYYIKKYYTDEYDNHIKAYEKYVVDKAAYDKYLLDKAAYDAGTIAVEPVLVDNPGAVFPTTLTVWVNKSTTESIPNPDGTNILKRQYFCEVSQKYNTQSESINGYTLVRVKDYMSTGVGAVTQYVYLAQGTPNPDGDANIPNDRFGFKVLSMTDVIAIGDEAFKGTTNVYNLVLSEDMAFIGDEAFMNSFVRTISFANVEVIGDRAFKNCSQLTNISFNSGTTTIGTESFYGCGLTGVSFPYSVKVLGPGSFANCRALTDVDMSSIAMTDAKISAFAFYDALKLNNISFSDTITEIGDAAFAVSKGLTGNLTEFTLPVNADVLGDFLFAGRGNLEQINMPENMGRTQPEVKLKENMFRNCYNLKCLNFYTDSSGASGYIDFSECTNIFKSVMNEDFYVYGPENNAYATTASPRKSTWGKISGAGKQVPYVYTDSQGNTHFEISDGDYILVIDDNGVLQSCTFSGSPKDIVMTIPEKVGNTKVTGVSSTCFQDPDIKAHMTKLVIEDNTISEIAPNAFKDFSNLTEVEIGDSVNKIGSSAFENCRSLEKVTFHSPAAGYASFPLSNLGDKAFSTGSNKLTFEGPISEDYGPFVWAMQTDNYVDTTTGVRVCYKTGYPYYLTVIIDNKNGLPTLVDYPHYEQLNKLSGTEGATYTVSDSDPAIGDKVLDISLTKRYEMIASGYPEYVDSQNGNVLYSYIITNREQALIDAALNLNIPSGIKSIDANGFFKNSSKSVDGYTSNYTNNQNISLYCLGFDDYATYSLNGLFNGYYGDVVSGTVKREYEDNSSYEKEYKGNDRIKSITMADVKYLPDGAFYSCEQLSSIILGSGMGDLGNAPFAGCTSLTSIGSSSADVMCYNGIVYSTNPDGTYTIVECLSSRGDQVGSRKIRVSDEDPYLANVSHISDGAFKDCKDITAVDLTGMDLLTEVPAECFMNCDNLSQVVLPDNIASINKNAFAGCMEGIELVVYGKEVYLSPSSFGTESLADEYDFVRSKRVISYADSAVRKAAADLGADVSETLDDTVKVQFFDYDGRELSKMIYVTKGASVDLTDIPADPIRDGYKFLGWNKPLTHIEVDTVIVATYEQVIPDNSDSTSTTTPNSNTPGPSTSTTTPGNTNNAETKFYTLTVTNGNGSGSYAAGATVIITCTNPPSGQVFDKWVPTTNDLGIASVNVAATTLIMPSHEASVTATFKNAPTNTGNNGGNNSVSNNNTTKPNKTNTIVISKSGISNTSLASASVVGSNDNYVIRIAETAAATAAVEKALTNEYGSLDNIRYTAMDITLYDATGTNKITDYNGLSVTLTLPIPDVMTQYAGNNKVAGVANEKLDKLNPKFTTIDGVPCITFTATHFSPYTIYVDTKNLSASATIDESPKTGDGIKPKWFLVSGLAALSIALFFMKDKKTISSIA